MDIIYQSKGYAPGLVTGVYVRHLRATKYDIFRVYEAATGTGQFAGRPGHGPTLREYDCDGSQFTPEFRALCIKSKQTEKLK